MRLAWLATQQCSAAHESVGGDRTEDNAVHAWILYARESRAEQSGAERDREAIKGRVERGGAGVSGEK